MNLKRFDYVTVTVGEKETSGEIIYLDDKEIVVRGVITEGEPLDKVFLLDDIANGKVKITRRG
jgi:hypothetical protein